MRVRKVRALVRTFATSEEQYKASEAKIGLLVERLRSYRVIGVNVIDGVDIFVWEDPRYSSDACGVRVASDTAHSADRLNDFFSGFGPHVTVRRVTVGDRYATILSSGLIQHVKTGVSHTLVVSPEASQYANGLVLDDVFDAAAVGALVVPVAIPEVRDLIWHGFACNTFCLWATEPAMQVGGFDVRDQVPLFPGYKAPHISYLEFEGKTISDSGTGEGIVPAKLFYEFGRPVTAPIACDVQAAYAAQDDQRWGDKSFKFRSKGARLRNMLKRSGYSMNDLESAVMRGYGFKK